jgi:hypothetical protein
MTRYQFLSGVSGLCILFASVSLARADAGACEAGDCAGRKCCDNGSEKWCCPSDTVCEDSNAGCAWPQELGKAAPPATDKRKISASLSVPLAVEKTTPVVAVKDGAAPQETNTPPPAAEVLSRKPILFPSEAGKVAAKSKNGEVSPKAGAGVYCTAWGWLNDGRLFSVNGSWNSGTCTVAWQRARHCFGGNIRNNTVYCSPNGGWYLCEAPVLLCQ